MLRFFWVGALWSAIGDWGRVVSPEVNDLRRVVANAYNVEIAVAIEVNEATSQVAFTALVHQLADKVSPPIILPDGDALRAAVLTNHQVYVAVSIDVAHVETVHGVLPADRVARPLGFSAPLAGCSHQQTSASGPLPAILFRNDDIGPAVTVQISRRAAVGPYRLGKVAHGEHVPVRHDCRRDSAPIELRAGLHG